MRDRMLRTVLCLLAFFPSYAAAGDPVPDVPPQRVTVRLLEYRYEPARIVLKAGRETELRVINRGTVVHEFVTEALQNLEVTVEVNGVVTETLGVAEVEIPPKGTVVLRFTPNDVGEFQVACHAMQPKDHFKTGMTAVLVVEPDR